MNMFNPLANPRFRPATVTTIAATISALVLLTGCAKTPKYPTPIPIYGRTPTAPGGPTTETAVSGTSTRLNTADPRASSKTPHSAWVDSEEVWIISRHGKDRTDAVSELDNRYGSGALWTRHEGREVPLPLRHTDVHAAISGFVGSVRVVQQFTNPYSSKIEAVYVFPLPQNAAVNEFIMAIGERRIRGIIREREEAEEIYQEAKREGLVASLLTEERPNVFTQSVANIEPGREIDVTIHYFHTLACVDGWYEFVFPMVVGPRFNPPGRDDGIGAVGRNRPGISGQRTEVSYLKPRERSGHDISVQVEVDAGLPIEEYECRTHQLVPQHSTSATLTLALDDQDQIPNRDLVLRYRLAGERVKSGLLTERDGREGYFALMLQPPRLLSQLERQGLELVFVLDCSGSMSGRPLEQAKAAVDRALDLLQPEDSFQLINFSDTPSQLGRVPLAATPANVQRAHRHLRLLNAEGGTMMIKGIQAALNLPHDPDRLRFVCFLTDGYIGNEAEILGAVHKDLGVSRIFSFGIGSSVNRYLLDHMAKLGHGAVAYLGLHDSAPEIMEDFFNRISHPALTDIRVDWDGLQVSDVLPRHNPDLFVGQPVVISGRFKGGGRHSIRLTGNAGGKRLEVVIPANFGWGGTAAGVRYVWANMKIAELSEVCTYAPSSRMTAQIKNLALEHGLTSPFTAFVAVDASRRTEGEEGTTVRVAVPVPQGVKYRTTVDE